MRWKVLIALLFLMAGFAARSQERPADEKPEISVLADFGFGGKVLTGRFVPVNVWVQAADDHIAGSLELEYSSQTGATGRVLSPVDVAAGKATSVAMVVPMPEYCDRVRLTLRTQGGARLAETVYESMPGSTSIQLPAMLTANEEMLLTLTPRVSAGTIADRFVEASMGWQSKNAGQQQGVAYNPDRLDLDEYTRRLAVMSRTVGTAAILEQLPLSSAAYEGVLAVVADGLSVRGMDPRAILAIQRWVLGGGRLVVLADQPGGAWRQLLPPGVPAESIRLGEPIEMATPSEIRVIAERDVFPTMRCRPMELNLLGEEQGWRTRWSDESGALIVEGPAGLGWVTIVSVDPDSVGAGTESWKLWLEVLAPAIEAVASRDGEARTLHNAPGYRYYMSLGRAMPGIVFDAIGKTTTIGSAAVLLVALVTVSLAVALGPADFFLLKLLRRRHLAWLSALVWIALASGVAVVAPNMLRAGPSVAARMLVADAILPNAALGDASDHPGQRAALGIPAELRGWNVGMTYCFAGSSESFELEDAEGNWFEYVASMQGSVVPRPTTMIQTARPGSIEAVRSSAPVRIKPGIWSVSTFIDTGPSAPELVVSLAPSQEGWALEVSGLGQSSWITTGALQIGDQYFRLGERYRVRQDGDVARVVFASDLASALPAREWGDPFSIDANRPYTQNWMFAERVRDLMPSALLALPGPRERSRAIEAYLDSGSFAMVSLMVTDQPMDLAISAGELESSRSTVYRLLVPIEGGSTRD